ncbi:hypothetical protein IWZ01DRAFT_352769 [Phyllosticta capitalensis]
MLARRVGCSSGAVVAGRPNGPIRGRAMRYWTAALPSLLTAALASAAGVGARGASLPACQPASLHDGKREARKEGQTRPGHTDQEGGRTKEGTAAAAAAVAGGSAWLAMRATGERPTRTVRQRAGRAKRNESKCEARRTREKKGMDGGGGKRRRQP